MRLRHILASTLAIMGFFIVACDRTSKDKPGGRLSPDTNVLLITLDTTRADRLGCYGYTKASTPTLDALARRATVFDDAHTTVTLTLPSHTTIMTGRYPREHGLRINGQGRLGEEIPTLASIFKEKGYNTAAFVASYVLDESYGLARGFTVYDDEMSEAETGDDAHESERSADLVSQRALKWLESNGDKRFFCWIHYYDPHHPYAPPTKFRQLLADPYDGELAFVDSELARVVSLLKSTGMLDRTLVVVAGDHGESFGEHGEFGHTTFLYETNLRVPLLFAHPALGSAARRIPSPVSLVDVFPTVLDLLGLAKPEGLLGRSLVPFLSGDKLDVRPCYAESEYALRVHNWAQQRTLITPEWKFVSSGKPELYDRLHDPEEKQNLASKHPDVVSKSQRTMEELYAGMTPSTKGKVALSDDAARRLESLGYVSGGGTSQVDEVLTPTLADPKDMIDVMMALKQVQKLVDANQHAEAVPILENAVNRSPQSVDILQQLGRAYLKSDRVDDAIATFRKAMLIEPDSHSALRALAGAFMQAKRPEEAIEHYQLALDLAPDDPQTQFNLGTALLGVQRTSEAIVPLREAVRLKPKYGDALVNLGIALMKNGALDEAEATLRQAVAAKSKSAEAHYVLSQLAAKRNQSDQVEAHLKKVLELKPAHVQASEDLSRFYLRNRRPADAVRILRAAVTNSPNDVGTALTLAEILASSMHDDLRDGKEAVRIAEAVVTAAQGRDVRALTTLAAAKAETGDFESAVQYAEKALGLAESARDEKLIPFIKAQLEAYRTKRPFRNSSF